MELQLALWLPILLSAVFIFVASSLFQMVIPIYKGDYKKMPGEENVLAAMRAEGVTPGTYMFPCSGSKKDMNTPEMVAKFNEGPVGFMTLSRNGPPAMGKYLIQWFLYTLLVSVFVAYITSIAHEWGAHYMAVFRLAGTAAILAYSIPSICDSIWKAQPFSVTLKFMFDGLVYGLLTAGTFGWLWPQAV